LRVCACSHEDVRDTAEPDRRIADRFVCRAVGIYRQVSPCHCKSRELREFATIHRASPRVSHHDSAKARMYANRCRVVWNIVGSMPANILIRPVKPNENGTINRLAQTIADETFAYLFKGQVPVPVGELNWASA